MYTQISAQQLHNKLNNGEKPILLDVREIYEHQQSNIPDSILIPLNELKERFEELSQYQDQEIVVYCKAGVRSQIACEFLAANGFSKLINLSDGIIGWNYLG